MGFVIVVIASIVLTVAAITLTRENRGVRIPYIGRAATDTHRAKVQRTVGIVALIVGGGIMTFGNPFNAAGFVMLALVPPLIVLVRHNGRIPPVR
ncbi:hypothetical protein [Microbacterium karelineae]|uniref:hypothetical protein n=1 Tax=Microbacterium karelineae TaxID=2654283 RepID=UPI0012EA9290|nr:hypothetical protein [Microbacterium karelineae]